MNFRVPLTVALLAVLSGCTSLRHAGDRPGSRVDRLQQGATALQHGDFRGAYVDLSAVYTACPYDDAGRRALLMLTAAEIDPRNTARRPDLAAEFGARYLTDPRIPEWTRPTAEALYLYALSLGGEAPTEVERPNGTPLPPESDTAGPVEPAQRESPQSSVADTRPAMPSDSVPDVVRPVAESSAGESEPGTIIAECRPPSEPRQMAVLPELTGESIAATLERGEALQDSLRASLSSAEEERAGLRARIQELEAQLAQSRQELERIRRTLRP